MKVRNSDDSTAPVMVAVVPSNTAGDTEAPTYAAMSVSGKHITTCMYCQQEGHVAAKCFVRIKDHRIKQKNKTSGASRASHQKGSGTMRKPAKTGNAPTYSTASSSLRDTSRPERYCLIHDSPTYSTEECYPLAKIKKTLSRRTGGTLSGEVTRPVRQKPG